MSPNTRLESILFVGSGLPCFMKNEMIDDFSVFVLEKYLEDFLVSNWSNTVLGKTYDIYTEDSEKVGQQYLGDTCPIDILAISKDKKELLAVELKKAGPATVLSARSNDTWAMS